MHVERQDNLDWIGLVWLSLIVRKTSFLFTSTCALHSHWMLGHLPSFSFSVNTLVIVSYHFVKVWLISVVNLVLIFLSSQSFHNLRWILFQIWKVSSSFQFSRSVLCTSLMYPVWWWCVVTVIAPLELMNFNFFFHTYLRSLAKLTLYMFYYRHFPSISWWPSGEFEWK